MQQLLKSSVRICERAFRILVVGRDVMSGNLLAEALAKTSTYQAQAIPPSNLISAAATGCFDLAVISVNLPSGEDAGIGLMRKLQHTNPRIPMVVLLDQPQRDLVVSAFRYGARGVFTRTQRVDQFIECVDHVRRGGIWTGPEETEYLLDAFKNIPAPAIPHAGAASLLTPRENQVISCAAQGKTNRTIAAELHLSEHTVKNYLFRAFEKLGVSSRVELLFYLTTQGVDLQSQEPMRALPSRIPAQSAS